jgi:hypothetical protein
MVAHLDFRGPPKVLQEFFTKVTAAYGNDPPLSSIYWQKLEAEFEMGHFISPPVASIGDDVNNAPPPHYDQQLKD